MQSYFYKSRLPFTFCLGFVHPFSGPSRPSMPLIVFGLLLSYSRRFPPPLLCRLAIFYFVVPLISFLSLVATLLSFILAVWLAHFNFCFSVYAILSIIFVLFLISGRGILSRSFRFNISPPLLFDQFLVVCQLFIKRPCFAATGHCWEDTLVHYLYFGWYGDLAFLKYFLIFSKTVPSCSGPDIRFFFCSVFEVCGLFKVFKFCHLFNFLLIN